MDAKIAYQLGRGVVLREKQAIRPLLNAVGSMFRKAPVTSAVGTALGGAGMFGGARELAAQAGQQTNTFDTGKEIWNPGLHGLRLNFTERPIESAGTALMHPIQTAQWMYGGMQTPNVTPDFFRQNMSMSNPDYDITQYDVATGKGQWTPKGNGGLTAHPIMQRYLQQQQQKYQQLQGVNDMLGGFNKKPAPAAPAAPAAGPGQQPGGGSYTVGGVGPLPTSRVQRRYLTLDQVGN